MELTGYCKDKGKKSYTYISYSSWYSFLKVVQVSSLKVW